MHSRWMNCAYKTWSGPEALSRRWLRLCIGMCFFFLLESRWMRKEKRRKKKKKKKKKKKRLLRGHIQLHVRPDQRDATNDDDQTTLEGALNVIHRREIDPEPIKVQTQRMSSSSSSSSSSSRWPQTIILFRHQRSRNCEPARAPLCCLGINFVRHQWKYVTRRRLPLPPPPDLL